MKASNRRMEEIRRWITQNFAEYDGGWRRELFKYSNNIYRIAKRQRMSTPQVRQIFGMVLQKDFQDLNDE